MNLELYILLYIFAFSNSKKTVDLLLLSFRISEKFIFLGKKLNIEYNEQFTIF